MTARSRDATPVQPATAGGATGGTVAIDARPAPLHHRRHRPVPFRPGRGRPRPDPHHARQRQAQGDRQGRPPADVAPRRQPRAVRRADRRARPRPDVRRRHPGQRRACLAEPARFASRAPRPPGTSPSSPTARSRSATRPSRCTRSCGAPTSCSTPGWRRAGSRAGTRCTCSTSSASAPRSTAASSATACSSRASAFRWVPPLGGVVCERCPGPPHDRTGLTLEALKLLKAYQRLDIEAHRRPAAWRPRSSARSRPPCASSSAIALERDARSLAFLDEVRHGPASRALMATVELRDIVTEDDREAVLGLRRGPGQERFLASSMAATSRTPSPTPAPARGCGRSYDGDAARRLRDDQRRHPGRDPGRRRRPGRARTTCGACSSMSASSGAATAGRPSTPSPTYVRAKPGPTSLLTSCRPGRGLAAAVLPALRLRQTAPSCGGGDLLSLDLQGGVDDHDPGSHRATPAPAPSSAWRPRRSAG